MTIWFWIRATLIAYSAFTSREMVSATAVAESNVTWIVAPIIAIVMLPFAILATFVTIRVSEAGRGPRWNSNPFVSFVDFWHLGAWACFAGGMGAMVSWLISSSDAGPLAVSYLVFGLCAVVGTKIGTVFGERTVPNNELHVTNQPAP